MLAAVAFDRGGAVGSTILSSANITEQPRYDPRAIRSGPDLSPHKSQVRTWLDLGISSEEIVVLLRPRLRVVFDLSIDDLRIEHLEAAIVQWNFVPQKGRDHRGRIRPFEQGDWDPVIHSFPELTAHSLRYEDFDERMHHGLTPIRIDCSDVLRHHCAQTEDHHAP
jgi:hypothetical protein